MDEFLKAGASFERLLKEYKQYGSLIVAVDFDNTLYDFHNTGATYLLMHDLVRKLKSINCEIIIWTGNQDTEMVKKFLADNNIPYDLINEDSEVAKKYVIKKGYLAPRKVFANVYLDDRAGLKECYGDLLSLYFKVLPESVVDFIQSPNEINPLPDDYELSN